MRCDHMHVNGELYTGPSNLLNEPADLGELGEARLDIREDGVAVGYTRRGVDHCLDLTE